MKSTMDNFSEIFNHDQADGGFFRKRKRQEDEGPIRVVPRNFQERLYGMPRPITSAIFHSDPTLKYKAECNHERLGIRIREVNEAMEQKIDYEQAKGFRFHKNQNRGRGDNKGVVVDFAAVANRTGMFPFALHWEVATCMNWYRWARNCWAHCNFLNALGYIEEYFTAMIFITGPNMLNRHDIETSLKDELARSQLKEVPLAILAKIPSPI